MYFSQVRVDPTDDKYLYVLGISLYRSTDGGKTFRGDGGRGVHADHHALWIDPRDGRHMIVGGDGGFYVTYDRMEHWDHLNHAAHRPVLPRRRRHHGATTASTAACRTTAAGAARAAPTTAPGRSTRTGSRVGGGDGFMCRVDPNDPDQVYSTSQDGAMGRRNLRTGESASIRPADRPSRKRRGRRPDGPARRPGQASAYRFNWNTPFILSHHNSRIFYAAGNYVFRSLDRGNDLRASRPKITRTDKGSATALAESPRNPNVLYVGTDDGALWVTKDGGKTWTDIAKNVGLPRPRCVATIEPSRFADGRAYVAFDGHRSDDRRAATSTSPRTSAQTWKSLRGEPAARLDALPARGHQEPGPALPRHRVRRLGRRSTGASRG